MLSSIESLLEYCGQDMTLAREIASVYTSNVLQVMSGVRDAVRNKDAVQLNNKLHEIKPSLLMFRADALYNKGKQIQAYIERGEDDETIEGALENFEDNIDRLQEFILNWLDK